MADLAARSHASALARGSLKFVTVDCGTASTVDFRCNPALERIKQMWLLGINIKTPVFTGSNPAVVIVQIGGSSPMRPRMTVTNGFTGQAFTVPTAGAAGWNVTDLNVPRPFMEPTSNALARVHQMDFSLKQMDGTALAHSGCALFFAADDVPYGADGGSLEQRVYADYD